MTFILPKKTRVLWQLRIAVAFIFVCFAILIVNPLNIRIIIFTIIVFLSGIFLVFVYIPIFIKNYKIVVDNQSLCIYKGVFIKRLTILPHIRLVFIKNVTTPMMLWLKLEIIMLKVARGWIFIPEIDKSSAKVLLRLINGEKE